MKLLGSIISGVGILIAGTSGLCSLVLLGAGISQNGLSGFGNVMMAVALFGGIPFVIGIGIHFAGSELVRDAKLEAAKKAERKTQESANQEPTATPSKENQ